MKYFCFCLAFWIHHNAVWSLDNWVTEPRHGRSLSSAFKSNKPSTTYKMHKANLAPPKMCWLEGCFAIQISVLSLRGNWTTTSPLALQGQNSPAEEARQSLFSACELTSKWTSLSLLEVDFGGSKKKKKRKLLSKLETRQRAWLTPHIAARGSRFAAPERLQHPSAYITDV